MERSFTLLELVIVIVILGILATLGFSQYTATVEKGRTAEALARIGAMRQLAYKYYIENGSLSSIQNSDVGVDYTCYSTDYFKYEIGNKASDCVNLRADRCTTGGKPPNGSTAYSFGLSFHVGSGAMNWYANDSKAARITGATYSGSTCP